MQNEKHENTTVSDSQTDVPTPPRAEDRANEKIKKNHGNENHKPEGLRPPEIKEDAFAWLQVLGAFCLNLNTWSAKSYGPIYPMIQPKPSPQPAEPPFCMLSPVR